MDVVTLGAALNGAKAQTEDYVSGHFVEGVNILITDNADGTQTISASGEVSSEDTVARAAIDAIKDGTTIDSFADVESALADKVDTVSGKGLSTNDFSDEYKTKVDNSLSTETAASTYQPIGSYATTNDIADMATETWVGQQGYLTSADEVPEVGSSDDGKVLTADYTGGTGSYSWESLPSVDEVPTVTSEDDGKVLKASYSGGVGTYSWQTGGGSGGTTDYTELSNKPQVNSHTLTGNMSTSDLGIYDVPTVGSSDGGKILAASYSESTGSYAWVAPDSAPTQNSDNVVKSGGVYTALADKANTSDLKSAAYAETTDFATATQGTKADSAVQSVKVNGSALTPDANKAVDITAIPASIVSAGALASGMTATTQETSDDSTKLATTAFVHDVVDALPSPMVYKGTLGTGGTKTTLPVDGTAEVGDTYKVITAGTYASQAAKVGDMFICLTKATSSNTWSYVPSGDDTDVTQVSAGTGLTTASGSPITTTGTIKAKLKSGTALAEAATNSTTSGKSYAVNVDSVGDLACNVPWTDTTYSAATTTTAGLMSAQDKVDLGNCQNNIVLLEKYGGGKNLFNNVATDGSSGTLSWTVSSDKSVTLSGSTNAANTRITLGTFTPKSGVQYVLSGCPSDGSAETFRIYGVNGNDARLPDYGDGYTFTGDGTEYTFYIYINSSGTNMNGKVFKPMICSTADWALSHDYQPYGLPNTAITPALIECVDSGAKNCLPQFNTNFTPTANVSFSYDTDHWIDVDITGTVSAYTQINLFGGYISNKFAGKKLYFNISNNPSNVHAKIVYSSNGSTAAYTVETVTNGYTITGDYPYIGIFIAIDSGATQDFKFKAMVCDESLYNVSQKIIPYAMDNATLTAAEQTNETNILTANDLLAEIIDSGAKNRSTVSGGSNVGGAGTIVADTTINLPAGDYVFYWKNTATNVSTVINCYTSDNTRVVNKNKANSAVESREINVPQDCVKFNLYCTGINTISDLMICTKAAWTISHKYVPYCPTLAELANQ